MPYKNIVCLNICLHLVLGNAALAREKIMSILQHVSGVHTFPSFQHFKKCEHGELEEQKPWIAPGMTWAEAELIIYSLLSKVPKQCRNSGALFVEKEGRIWMIWNI